MHEAGHGMYEQGIAKSLGRTVLQDGASLAVHESQSRMWENLVGRSKPFWNFFYPKLQTLFPEQLKNVSEEMFYKGINKVEPSLIRVEADEATYNLHVMLRLEIELGLISGEMSVNELPEIWNKKMSEYLGVTPTTDADGVLQDVHWSYGAIGYFSTYTLGNLIASQLWDVISHEISDISKQISSGEFSILREWLGKNIHCHGAKYTPLELVKRVTGNGIKSEPYLNYLEEKYFDIYGIN
jgi:carboxypeptidase Taq